MLSEETKSKLKTFVNSKEREYREECGSDFKTYLIEDAIGEIIGYDKDKEEDREEAGSFIYKVLNGDA